MSSSIKAILFDVGGTLRFTERVEGREERILVEMRDFLGLDLSIQEFKDHLTAGEKNYRKWAKKSLVELNEQELWTRFMLPEFDREFTSKHAVKLNQLWRSSKGKKHLLPNAVETLKTLAARGYKLCIISNTTSSVEVPQLLEEQGIKDIFSEVILSTVYGKRKPHPSLFLAAARSIGVHPEECAYVGDRPSRDVVGAREAGFSKVVIIQAAGLKVESSARVPMKPDHLIKKLPELLEIFPERSQCLEQPFLHFQPDYLYDAALSTMWGIDSEIPFVDSFHIGREIGFARFELNHAVSPEMFAQIDFDRFRIGSVHDPCPATYSLNQLRENDWLISSLDEECRKKGVEILLGTIDLAARLGANSVVVHPGQINGDRSMDRKLRTMFKQGLQGTDEYEVLRTAMMADRNIRSRPHLEAVLRSLAEIIPHCRDVKISLALENRYRYYDIPILDELESMLDLCHEPWYGFQYDVGHAQTLSRLGLCDHEEWLKRCSKRIIGTHLHDVVGIMDHQFPGVGDVDFEMVAAYLPDDAIRTLEVSPAVTSDELKAGMDLLVHQGCVKKI